MYEITDLKEVDQTVFGKEVKVLLDGGNAGYVNIPNWSKDERNEKLKDYVKIIKNEFAKRIRYCNPLYCVIQFEARVMTEKYGYQYVLYNNKGDYLCFVEDEWERL